MQHISWVTVPAILLIVFLLAASLLFASGTVSAPSVVDPTHSASLPGSASPPPPSISITSDGATGSAIGVSWTGGPGFWYNDYYVYYGLGESGPWGLLGGTYTSDTSYYVFPLSPSTTYWFYINDKYLSGSVVTLPVSISTSAKAQLSVSSAGLTSEDLQWTNPSYYSSVVGFYAYQVWDQVNSGTWTMVGNISEQSTLSYTVTGLPSGSSDSFYVDTVTQCLTCSTPDLSYSQSNHAGAQTVIPPSVTISPARTSVDIGQSDSFIATPSGGQSPYTYAWTFSDGFTSSSQVVSHSFGTQATQTVTVVLTDNLGERATSAVSVSVSSALAVAIQPSSTSVTTGQVIDFSATVSGGSGGETYQWGFGDTSSSTSSSPTHSYSTAGTYTVYLAVTDSDGNTEQATPTVITVSTPSNANYIAGLPPTTFYAVLTGTVVAIVIVAVSALVLVRRRAKAPPSSGAPGSPAPPTPPS